MPCEDFKGMWHRVLNISNSIATRLLRSQALLSPLFSENWLGRHAFLRNTLNLHELVMHISYFDSLVFLCSGVNTGRRLSAARMLRPVQ